MGIIATLSNVEASARPLSQATVSVEASLEWAEAEQGEILDLTPANWDQAEAADSKLHDFHDASLSNSTTLQVACTRLTP